MSMMLDYWGEPSTPSKPTEVAAAPLPPAPPAPVTTIDGLTITDADQGQLEAALKKRMSLLLKAHHSLVDLTAARDLAKGEQGRLLHEYKQSSNLPASTNVDVLSAFFTQTDQRYCAFLQAQAVCAASEREVAKANEGLGLTSDELAKICQALTEARPQMAGAPVFLAASHLAGKAKAVKQSTTATASGATATGGEIAQRRAADQEQITAINAARMRLALAATKATALAITVKATQEAITARSTADDITRPVRPTEEEVQRYLRELEMHMTARQKTHRIGFPLFVEQADLLLELNSAAAALNTLLEAYALRSADLTIAVPHQLSAAAVVAGTVREAYDVAHSKLYWASRADDNYMAALDTFERATPSPKEVEQIEILRKGMRELAYSFARLNEANAAQKATDRIDEVSVERTGIGASTTLDGAIDWLSQNDLLQEEARKQNLSRSTKLELLRESISAFTAEVKSIKTSLHRTSVSLLPRRNEKPCDQLRALFNAAAWMYKSLEEDEAAYPVY
jgi:hypothetical protein